MVKSFICFIILIVSTAGKAAGFLFTISQSGSPNSRMCIFPCDLSCPNGYVLSLLGCYLCSCASPEGSNGVHGIPSGIGGGLPFNVSSFQETFLTNPCMPSIRYCLHTRCVDGLQTGPGGCQYCACAVKPTDRWTTKETSTVPSDISKPPNASSAIPIISTNLTDIKSHAMSTTQAAPTTMKVFKDPCILSMNTCEKDCGEEYVKGPEGCEYCLCQTMIHIPTTTIATTATTTQTESKDNSSLPLDRDAVMIEACVIARTICQMKCPHGFHTKANDCFFCECVDDSGQFGRGFGMQIGFSVTLPNPCVRGMDYCGLLCLSGYWMGPRSCQYCSCRG